MWYLLIKKKRKCGKLNNTLNLGSVEIEPNILAKGFMETNTPLWYLTFFTREGI